MSCTFTAAKQQGPADAPAVTSIVVVDSRFDAYRRLASAAQQGLCTVHFRGSGSAALHLLSRHRADAVIVGAELDDMSRQDFVDLLVTQRFATQQAASRPVVLMAEASGGPLVAAGHGRLVDGGAVVRHPILWRDVENHLYRRTARGHAAARTAIVIRALNTLVGGSIAALVSGTLLSQ